MVIKVKIQDTPTIQLKSSTGSVKEVNSGDGLTGGPIVTVGTISILANTGLIANSSGLFVDSSVLNPNTVNGNTAQDLRDYSDLAANTAYANAISYADDISNTAYANAISYADDAANTAYVNAISYADDVANTAYANAISYADDISNTAYANAIAYVDDAANTAYANAISYADDAANTAYANAIVFASNASNINTGSLATSLLEDSGVSANTYGSSSEIPILTVDEKGRVTNISIANVAGVDDFVYDSSNNTITLTAGDGSSYSVLLDQVNNFIVTGNLTVTGEQTYIQSNTVLFDDNMIRLNAGLSTPTPDIGFVGFYSDDKGVEWNGESFTWGNDFISWNISNAYGGFFRDSSDGIWKLFESYAPSPDTDYEIDINDSTYKTADLQLDRLYINSINANGSVGNPGQVLHSDGSGVYWDTDDQGVTSITIGDGLSGGSITNTGTISVLANSGIIANSTGTFVNSAYISTIASNSATYANSSVTNTFTVGTASYFVANGNLGVGNTSPTHKLRVEGDISLTGGIHANSSLGTSGQVLTSNGSISYWTDPTFNSLTDTPTSFDGYGNYIVRVNSAQTALEFTNTIEVANIKMDAFKYVSQIAPSDGTISEHTVFSYLTSTGVDPNRKVELKLKDEKNRELVIGGFANTFTIFGPTSNQGISLITNNSSKVFISANGNVGIGTTTPSDKLVIDGTVNLSAIKANNSIGTSDQILTSNGTGLYWTDLTFNTLSDTPTSYSTYGSSLIQVKADETGVEYVDEINIDELQLDTMTYVSQLAPSDGTIEEDTLAIYVTASGVSPTREIAFKIKTQNNEEIILASTLV